MLSNSAYQKLAQECLKYNVRVQLFLFYSGYCDVARLNSYASTTGRIVYYLPHYLVGRIFVYKTL